jgi:hypothetical protein
MKSFPVDEHQRIAQVVFAGLSGVLTEVRLPVSCLSGSLRVEIQGVTGLPRVPNGTVLAAEEVPAATLPPFRGDPTFRSIRFNTPVVLTAGTRFAIVLASDGNCEVFRGPERSSSYAAGGASFEKTRGPLRWQTLSQGEDLPFETVGFHRVVVAAGGLGGGAGRATRLVLPLSDVPHPT